MLLKKMVKMKNKGLLLLLFFCFFINSLFSDEFGFSSDRLSTVLAQGKQHTLLSGNAEMISDNTTITAQEIELYGKDFQFAICRGDVTVVDKKQGITLTSEKVFFDRKGKRTRVEGDVVMEDIENEMIIKGGFLENLEEEDITIIQIGVRILKEDLVCRAEFAIHNRAEETLELTGLPVVFRKGDEYKAARITINLKTDEIIMEGDVSGTVSTEAEDENATQDGTE